MKWSTTVSFALAAGGALALVALVSHERSQTAEQFWGAVQKRYSSGSIDREQYLRELALAQSQFEVEGRHDLATQVQLLRGSVLLDLGSFAEARTEFAAVAAEGGERRELELLRMDLERRAGEPAAGLALARAWLARHPGDSRAWSLASQLRRMQADAAREAALLACTKQLVSEDVPRAQACVRGLSARPASDPRRIALARDLRAIYGVRLESEVEGVLVNCATAASENAAAREAAGRSLGLGFDADVLAALAELSDQAGQGDEALDLLLAASNRPGMAESARASAFLLHALVEHGRWRYATRVATAWLEKHSGSRDFLLDACRAAYGARGTPEGAPGVLYNWGFSLFQVRSNEIGEIPAFYMGEAFFQMGSRDMLGYARLNLSKFALTEGPEPFPGARPLALRHIAESCRTLGLASEERQALESAVSLDPDGSGESWLRLAELQSASTYAGFRVPDASYAKGMALLPQRTAELLPRWKAIGAEELRAIGLDPRSLRQDIESGLRIRPSNGAAPFELYTLASAHLEAGKLYEAQTLMHDLEAAVPGFLPALDLRIDLAKAQGRVRDLVEAFLARLEKVGFDERSQQLRAALPAGALTQADLRRVVNADPETSGRLAIAHSFAARGERDSALRFLRSVAPAKLGPTEQLFGARLELESNDPKAAFARLETLAADLDTTPGALEAWIDAGLRADEAEALRDRLPARIAALPLDRTRFLALADRLLASGEAGLARGLLQRLDSAGRGFGGGELLWRLSACDLALGQPEAFARHQERAAAFDTHGQVELLELLALAPDADGDARAGAVHAVRSAGWVSSALGKAALALFAGDTEALPTALAAARKQDPGQPLCALLAEPPGDAHCARTLARLVLELERPSLCACALKSLEELGDCAGMSWPEWIRASLHRGAGEREAEERTLRALLERDPKFVAAWDRLVQLHTLPADEGECDLDLRLARAAALGEDSGSEADRDWDSSRALEREGKLEEALEAARKAAAAAPDSGPILHQLGRLALRMQRLPIALLAYRRALPLLPAASGARSTAEYLELIEEGRASDPPLFGAESERSELEKLAQSRPDDPRVLLAQARNDLETSATDPSFGAERAAQRLASFRSKHAQGSFEALAPGSTESWTRFLLELDPQRARDFLEDELGRDPGNVDAWALRPRCSAAESRDEDALAEVSFVQRLAPGREGLSEYLRVRARGDWTVEGVGLIAERMRRLDPVAANSPASMAVELRAYLNLGPPGVPKALQLGVALAPARLARETAALRAEIYWLHAVALLARGEGDDLAQARLRVTVLDTLERDPARRPLLAALRGLAQAPQAP